MATPATGHRLDVSAARDQHKRAVQSSAPNDVRWALLVGGGLLATFGLTRGTLPGLLVAAAGGSLAYYGYTGRLPVGNSMSAPDGESSVRVERTITINRPPAEIYAEWHDIEQLPRIMSHLVSVKGTADGRSHWVAKGPAGRTVEWDAEVIHDHEDRIIAWRSVGDTNVPNTGSVRFEEAPGGRGTELRVTLEYSPPGGAFGATVAKLFGEEPSQQIADDLRRFKQYQETGEYPTTAGQSRGGSQSSMMDTGLQKARQAVEAIDSAITGD